MNKYIFFELIIFVYIRKTTYWSSRVYLIISKKKKGVEDPIYSLVTYKLHRPWMSWNVTEFHKTFSQQTQYINTNKVAYTALYIFKTGKFCTRSTMPFIYLTLNKSTLKTRLFNCKTNKHIYKLFIKLNNN